MHRGLLKQAHILCRRARSAESEVTFLVERQELIVNSNKKAGIPFGTPASKYQSLISPI